MRGLRDGQGRSARGAGHWFIGLAAAALGVGISPAEARTGPPSAISAGVPPAAEAGRGDRPATANATARVYEVSDTVQVSGERLPADPRRAPYAITVLSGADLRLARGVGIEEALTMAPGILALSRSGGTDVRITSRGFGARGAGERSNAGTTRGIRILLDGSPLTEPDGRTSLDLADPAALERVTVLRSNGSVLFGSAAGGVIDLSTTSDFRRSFTAAQAGGGAFGLRRWVVSQGLAGGPVRVSLGGSGSRFNGWRAHSENERTILRGSLFSEPTPRVDAAFQVAGTHNLSRIPGALTRAQVANRDSARAANPDFVHRDERRDNRILRVSTNVEYRYAPSRLLEIAGFVEPKTLHRSERRRYRDFQRIHDGASVRHAWSFAPSARVAMRWSAGFDGAWQDGSTVFYDLGPGGTRGTSTMSDKREAIQTLGLYSEVEARIGPRWTFAAGLRGDRIRYVYDDHLEPWLNSRKLLREVTPRGAVSLSVADGHIAWAAVTSGLEAPAFNETDPPAGVPAGLNPILKPARSRTYEGGLKGSLCGPNEAVRHLDRVAARIGDLPGAGEATAEAVGAVIEPLVDALSGPIRSWTYDIAAYRVEVRNDIIPWDGGAYYFMDGMSRRHGVEIATELRSAYGFHLSFSGALSRNKHVTYRNELGNFDGRWSAGIPGRALNGVLRWEPRSGFYLEAAARHLGPYYADDANTARVPAWTVLDGAVGARAWIDELRADVSLSVRNLTDRLYTESVWVNGADGRFYEPGLPRNVAVSITLRRE